jgi:3-oxo-5-alpha-steroid 4-dehydrogenase 1
MTWYTGDPTYDTVLLAAFGLVVLVAVVAPFVASPYGRFASARFGVALDPRLGWFLMELPSTLSFVIFFALGARRAELVPLIFLVVWLVHYGNRGFVFPALMRVPRGDPPTFGILVITTGWFVTSLHGYLNAAFITAEGTHLTEAWLKDPRFLVGLTVYYAALAANIHSDAILRNLRSKEEIAAGEKVYRIPQGGLFRWVSNPSYLTEIVAWTGFAVATWSLGSVFVLGMTLANLVPRAISTHRWYLERFPDYPSERRILIPFVW